MRRTTAWFVVVGVVALGTAVPARAADGFWVSVASGMAGSATPSDYQDWWFETPHGPPPIAVTRLGVTGNVEATTGGGSSFFNGGAVPVVLSPSDGYAYLAAGNKPTDLAQALRQQLAGGKGLASTIPDAIASEPPADALRLAIDQNEPGASGATTLTFALTDATANVLGTKSVVVPDGGWWVIGLGPNPNTMNPDPDDDDDDDDGNSGGNNGGGSDNGGGDGNSGGGGGPMPGPVATPEPATALLAGIGGLSAFGIRLVKRRRLK